MEPVAPRLQEFINAAKLKGAGDESLIALLTRSGWSAPQGTRRTRQSLGADHRHRSAGKNGIRRFLP